MRSELPTEDQEGMEIAYLVKCILSHFLMNAFLGACPILEAVQSLK